jgi:hypothetical protein
MVIHSVLQRCGTPKVTWRTVSYDLRCMKLLLNIIDLWWLIQFTLIGVCPWYLEKRGSQTLWCYVLAFSLKLHFWSHKFLDFTLVPYFFLVPFWSINWKILALWSFIFINSTLIVALLSCRRYNTIILC